MFSSHFRLIFTAALLAAPLAAQCAPQYAYTALGLSTDKGGAYAISKSGNVAGAIQLGGSQIFQPFLRLSNGQFIPLGFLPGSTFGVASGVNSAGQVVGITTDGAFLYSKGQLVQLPGFVGDLDINDAGVIAGTVADQAAIHVSGKTQLLGSLVAGARSRAFAINNRGDVVGSSELDPASPWGNAPGHAVLFSGGRVKDLGALGGAPSQANNINELGEVVGTSYRDPNRLLPAHAFLYSNGEMRDLGAPLEGVASSGLGINVRSQAVGNYDVAQGRAFIWDRRNGMHDLSTMVDPASGWFLHAAFRINERGQIVALGCKNGQYGPVLLTPTGHDDLRAIPRDAGVPVPWDQPQTGTGSRPARGATENPACAYG